MDLTYDFDIHSIIPETVTSDPKVANMMTSIGFDFGAEGNKMALFRDPATVQALRGADEDVRAFFEASGFGFKVYDSGAGPGRFPAHNQTDIHRTIERLSENAGKIDLAGKDWNGFDMVAFLEHIVTMKPVQMPMSDDPKQEPPAHDDHTGARMTPLDRVRARHGQMDDVPPLEGDDTGHGPQLPDPEVAFDPAAAKRIAAADLSYRLKSGLPLVGLGVLLFAVAISQGRNLTGSEDANSVENAGAVANETAIQSVITTTREP